jgi:hypothetical protein
LNSEIELLVSFISQSSGSKGTYNSIKEAKGFNFIEGPRRAAIDTAQRNVVKLWPKIRIKNKNR